jgi:hypothetical protein
MPVQDLPAPDTVRDYAVLDPHVRRVARETWFDPDWLWNLAKGMQDAGVSTDRTLEALLRQHRAHRLAWHKRLWRRVQIKVVKGFWAY